MVLDFLPKLEFTGYKQAIFRLFLLLLSCTKFTKPEDSCSKGFAPVLDCLVCPLPPGISVLSEPLKNLYAIFQDESICPVS